MEQPWSVLLEAGPVERPGRRPVWAFALTDRMKVWVGWALENVVRRRAADLCPRRGLTGAGAPRRHSGLGQDDVGADQELAARDAGDAGGLCHGRVSLGKELRRGREDVETVGARRR